MPNTTRQFTHPNFFLVLGKTKIFLKIRSLKFYYTISICHVFSLKKFISKSKKNIHISRFYNDQKKKLECECILFSKQKKISIHVLFSPIQIYTQSNILSYILSNFFFSSTQIGQRVVSEKKKKNFEEYIFFYI